MSMERASLLSSYGAQLVLTAACSTHPKRVDCEGHLRAINAPAPMKKPRAIR